MLRVEDLLFPDVNRAAQNSMCHIFPGGSLLLIALYLTVLTGLLFILDHSHLDCLFGTLFLILHIP